MECNGKNTPQQNQRIIFTGAPGVRVRLGANPSALDCYQLFMDHEIMDMILKETNRFGSEKTTNWKAITMNDLYRVFALVMLKGIIRKPTLKSYWSTDPILATPMFNSVISRGKFMRILGALHFVDNSNPSTDRCYKINDVLKKLNYRFAWAANLYR